MYPKHVGHENGGCGPLGRAPLSRPTFGGYSCKKDCMVAPHESVLVKGIFNGEWHSGMGVGVGRLWEQAAGRAQS